MGPCFTTALTVNTVLLLELWNWKNGGRRLGRIRGLPAGSTLGWFESGVGRRMYSTESHCVDTCLSSSAWTYSPCWCFETGHNQRCCPVIA